MIRNTVIGLGLALLAVSGCGKDANTQMCLDEFAEFEKAHAAKDEKAKQLAGGIYQTCGISCDVVKDAEACAAFKTVTEVICDMEGKDACQALCDGGNAKNETACSKVAGME